MSFFQKTSPLKTPPPSPDSPGGPHTPRPPPPSGTAAGASARAPCAAPPPTLAEVCTGAVVACRTAYAAQQMRRPCSTRAGRDSRRSSRVEPWGLTEPPTTPA